MNKNENEEITNASGSIIEIIIQSIIETFEKFMKHPDDVYDLKQIKTILESIKGSARKISCGMLEMALSDEFLDDDEEN